MADERQRASVSVLVPLYNTDAYVRQCLDSLVHQTLGDIEIIVVDDGSTDNSGAIADEYAHSDARVRVIHKPNSGYGDSLNVALEHASAPWIAICEPDDWAEPAMCEHLLQEALRFEGAGTTVDIVKGSYTRITNAQAAHPVAMPVWTYNNVNPRRQPFTIDECPVFLAGHPSIWTALYRKSFLDEFGIRFRPIPGAGWADNPFLVETLVAARSIVYLDELVYNYREFEDGTISHLKDWRIIVDRWSEMADVLRKYDVEIPSIIEAHDCRGCAYLQMLHADFPQSDELLGAARAMAASIDFDIVKHSSFISKEYKRALSRYLPLPKRLSLLAGWLALHARNIARGFTD